VLRKPALRIARPLCAIEQKKLIPEKYGMRRIILILFIISAFGTIQAQNTFKAFLKDEETKEPLIFANINYLIFACTNYPQRSSYA
jgi:hypothetical protein